MSIEPEKLEAMRYIGLHGERGAFSLDFISQLIAEDYVAAGHFIPENARRFPTTRTPGTLALTAHGLSVVLACTKETYKPLYVRPARSRRPFTSQLRGNPYADKRTDE